jgi:hypothetical protein
LRRPAAAFSQPLRAASAFAIVSSSVNVRALGTQESTTGFLPAARSKAGLER